jgi:hypothetical protein
VNSQAAHSFGEGPGGDQIAVVLPLEKRPLERWRKAVFSSDLPSTTRLVLMALSIYARDRGGVLWPSTRTIATSANLSRQSVMHHLKLARDKGWITIRARLLPRLRPTDIPPNEYTLRFPDWYRAPVK